MHSELGEVLYTEDQIKKRIEEIGAQLSADYQGKDLVIIVILRGAVVFLADLTRCMNVNATIDFIGCDTLWLL